MPPPAAALSGPVRFGRCELQPHERRLLVDGRETTLGSRAFDVLLTLAARAGQLVSKNELLDAVWPGVIVEENNLATQVSNLRKALGGDVIATIPGRGYRFIASFLTAPVAAPASPPAPAPAPAPADAPPPPTLIGRDTPLAELRRTLQHPGCTTLAGSSGVGKTSLARALAAAWPAGAVWVDLAALTDGAQMLPALARALDVPLPQDAAAESLARTLGARLLVLDNAEHVVDAAAGLVAALLAQPPQAVPYILVTSQWPLALAAERVHRVEPLAADAALGLLLDRARAADHRYAPGSDAEPALRDICRQLDGLPLALEMAAARLPALGVSGVRDALASRFALLSHGFRGAAERHRTLRAAFDWSHGLLGAEERRVFRALGVFSGGFTLELVQRVAADDSHDRWSVTDTLALLVERSLVAVDRSDPPRYWLLETLRADALARLAAAGEEAALRRRLALALHPLFVAAHGAALRATDHGPIATALAEHDNARVAIAWCVAEDPALALPLATAVSAATTWVSWRHDAFAWLESCAAVEADPRVSAADRAAWWGERARQHMFDSHPDAAPVARQALALQRALGDDKGIFRALMVLVRGSTEATPELHDLCDELDALLVRHPEWGPVSAANVAGTRAHACILEGDFACALAERLREHALALQAGSMRLAETAESNVCDTLSKLGRHDEALARLDALLQRIDDPGNPTVAYARLYRVNVLLQQERRDDVRRELPLALDAARRGGLPILADCCALFAARDGRPRAAALLVGAARAAYAAAGSALVLDAEARLQQAQDLALRVLDGGTFEALAAAGRRLDADAADALALALHDAA